MNIENIKHDLHRLHTWLKADLSAVEAILEDINGVIKSKTKRDWYNYRLPKVLADVTNKRGFYTWEDLTKGSKGGFRHNILLWAFPKVEKTYKKRIKTILNSHYEG